MEKEQVLDSILLIDLLEHIQIFKCCGESEVVSNICDTLKSKGFEVRTSERILHVSRKSDTTLFSVKGTHIRHEYSNGTEVLNHLLTKWGNIA